MFHARQTDDFVVKNVKNTIFPTFMTSNLNITSFWDFSTLDSSMKFLCFFLPGLGMLTHKKASLARNNGEIIIIMMMVSMMVDSYHYLYKVDYSINGDAGGDLMGIS